MQLQAIAGGYTQNVINGCMQNFNSQQYATKGTINYMMSEHSARLPVGLRLRRPSTDHSFGCGPKPGRRAQSRELPARTISRSSKAGRNMIDEHFEGRSGSRHYSRWPNPWRREDDWGPITAAVMFFVILAGLIVYGSGAHL